MGTKKESWKIFFNNFCEKGNFIRLDFREIYKNKISLNLKIENFLMLYRIIYYGKEI